MGLLLSTGCGGNSPSSATGAAGTDDSELCEAYPSEEINLLVPFSAGGGFDAWARLLAPYLEEELGGDAAVRVVNQPGGGGMRAVATTYAAAPDGTTLLFTEPGYIITNQILGRVESGFDVKNFTLLGSVTLDPDVFYVSSDSDIDTMEELAEQSPVTHANQQTQPQEIIVYDTFGIEANTILHEGTSDVILSVRRGDADVSRGSLSSLLPYLQSGDIKPIMISGADRMREDQPGAEYVEDVETIAEAGHAELNEVLEYRRVLLTAPETPECIATELENALASTLEDESFLQDAEDAGLVVVPASAEDTEAFVDASVEGLAEFEDILLAELGD